MSNLFDESGAPVVESAPRDRYESILALVEKPSRYVGQEVNRVLKDLASVKLRMALAFPDVYEVGMSHLGLKILYHVVNSRPDLYAERVFAPWPDLEAVLRSRGHPLTTLETATPLNNMDFVGFSLQYELCATTVLQMLDLGAIPIRSANRTLQHPFVVGGGPAACNPLPLAPFFDAFVIGDGEEAILEMADEQIRWKQAGGTREDLLGLWRRLPGVWVPSLHQEGDVVRRRVLADLNSVNFPTDLVVPFCETVHDRVGMEVARGCTRGCRFCQAGMIYRPVRERDPGIVFDLARKSVAATGWDEVALLSLSTGDYSFIGELIGSMAGSFTPDKVALSLPSLRTDTFSTDIARQISTVRKTGFTLAPEAGTDRLRRIINKGNTEEDLEKAVTGAFQHGWKSLKLYFMIGLPLETDQDLDGIIGLIRKSSKWAKGGSITAAISTFVPKAHTPFQWAGQISIHETLRRQHYIKRYFSQGKIRIKFHSAKTSFLEGVLARGDHRLADVIEAAFRKGARLDGWDDRLDFDLWMETFKEPAIDPEAYLQPRSETEPLPWNLVDSGVSTEFLLEEWNRARGEAVTTDCRFGDCTGCGVCDFREIGPKLAGPMQNQWPPPPQTNAPQETPQVRRFRLRYAKNGAMRFLGHHDVVRAFHRAFRRAGIRLDYSKGFHPHPRLRFSPPCPVGVESLAEYVDIDLVDSQATPDEVEQSLRLQLPEGLIPLEVNEISLNTPPVSARILSITYEFQLLGLIPPAELRDKVEQFALSPALTVRKVRKGKIRSRDLKQWITDLEAHDSVLRLTLKADPSGSVNPLDAIEAIAGLTRDATRMVKIVKTSVTVITSDTSQEVLSHEE